MNDFLLALIALGPTAGSVIKRLLDAALFGIRRYVEPYYLAHEEKVKAKSELEVFRRSPLRQLEFAQKFMKNAGGRFPEDAVLELKNIYGVIRSAVGCADAAPCGDAIYSEAEDKEWYSRFFDEAKYISDAELQEVWGRLLTERMSHPEGVNNRVLYFIRDLDKREIEVIRRSMRVFLDDDFTPNNVSSLIDGMSTDIPALLSLRVIYMDGNPISPLVVSFDLTKQTVIEGHGYDFKMVPIGDISDIHVTCCALTPEGQVLSRLCVSDLTREEAQIMCDHLNACWKGRVRVEVVEKGSRM